MNSHDLLRALIKEIVSTEPPKMKQIPKIWLAGREITMGLDVGYHAWIMVQDPRDPPGTIKTYSGKSGVDFESGLGSTISNKLRTGKARDQSVDAFAAGIKSSGGEEAGRKALELTTWGPLRKLKNWDSDKPAAADEKFELFPIALLQPDQAAVNQKISISAVGSVDEIMSRKAVEICDKIERAFNNYTQNVPYDPYPQMSSNSSSRNSNSFAYTLALIVNPAMGASGPSGFKASKYPGWGLTVPGLSP